ncbi:cytochrome c biogenesis protein ResB [Paraburkholderia azotifigens]|uniref:Cytochrome c biogenesis protein ResB n=1 Tax=Paraburkholderia azotifigens TaxID=2057004 RepID=A0A5C6VE25_9BURK|nr:cytochrome c biogenesis protein ResB [Paraburkholderia azotifigens]TXC81298.1 cytochrome c biogenesis protein ResB [Paraburkholderia azotifigens]
MRFAIALLVILAIASIVGTVLTQEDTYVNYVNQFGPFWADVFRGLDLYDVYGSWWFMLILVFLVISVSLCVIDNAPKMVRDARSWKDRVREGSLRAFHHKSEFRAAALSGVETAEVLMRLGRQLGYKLVTRNTDTGEILIAGKRGALTKLGYISAHLAIVVICMGGLLDSNLPIQLQMWFSGKTATELETDVDAVSPDHRLSPSNPTFRGYSLVPEGRETSTVLLSRRDGSLIQDLPFSIQLKKFVVDYYSTGMPKLFASDIVVTDHKTGQRVQARVEVNKPFTYNGISIYQSSFQDGGSKVAMTVWPMAGTAEFTEQLQGVIGGVTHIHLPTAGESGETVELTDFRSINVEDIHNTDDAHSMRGALKERSLESEIDARLGSGAKSNLSTTLRNLGPSMQYKVRDINGQAHEYQTFMLPVNISGQQMFMTGVRLGINDSFRFLRIPADDHNSVRDWVNLRAALQSPSMRSQAVSRFVQRSYSGADTEAQKVAASDVSRLLDHFAGVERTMGPTTVAASAGGFMAIAGLVDHSTPAVQQEKAAMTLLRTLNGVMWDLWQLSRIKHGEPEMKQDPSHISFIRASVDALSDSFYYGAPIFVQLDSFTQVQASAFQLTRAPGKPMVYIGSLLLVIGIFSMFYVRERRLWFWIKSSNEGGAEVLMAMSTARRTLDFEREFASTRDAVHMALDTKRAQTS